MEKKDEPRTWIDLVKQVWGKRRGKNQVEWLLWEATSFPFIPGDWEGRPDEWIKKQLTELHEKAGGDMERAKTIVYEDERAVCAALNKSDEVVVLS